jgi:hypothetical protein
VRGLGGLELGAQVARLVVDVAALAGFSVWGRRVRNRCAVGR